MWPAENIAEDVNVILLARRDTANVVECSQELIHTAVEFTRKRLELRR